ncbi:AAA family ATPase [Mycolicibacterium obuense]|uniref:AAA family ATPase n=1 Tax=Mycolicibacterium obuense TaxID=1807 RepID=UPI0023F70D97|nr:AAA family ATPase [Mycolicibacterium obuense]
MRDHAAILITGMSGVGKTTALDGLSRQGFATFDTDEGDWIDVVDGEPLWREPLLAALLSRPRPTALFVAGTVVNQGVFYDRFDAVVLLSAPSAIAFQRIAERTNNPFGKSDSERRQIARDMAEIEPLLRQAATHEIVTVCPPEEVIAELVVIARTVSNP